RTSSTTCVFPLCFGRQPKEDACSGIKPFTKLYCSILGHTYCRMIVFTHTKRHVEIWLGGSGNCIYFRINSFFDLIFFKVLVNKRLKKIPGNFMCTHPKRTHLYAMLRSFVFGSSLFIR